MHDTTENKLFPFLSDDLAVGILSWLSKGDLVRLARVCKDAKRLASDHTLPLAQDKKRRALQPFLQSLDVSELRIYLRTCNTVEDIYDFIPDTVEDRTRCLHTLLMKCLLPQDSKFFLIIHELLRRGTPLPALNYPPCSDKKEYLQRLSTSFHDLFIMLNQAPHIVLEQDENGNTLLHHVIINAFGTDPVYITTMLQLLFNAALLNFNIPNKEGDSPLHMLASCCNTNNVYQHFLSFIQKALAMNFDFSLYNAKGMTVLHTACALYNDRRNPNSNSLNHIAVIMLKNIPKDRLDINRVCQRGETALCYLINSQQFERAKIFLIEGADPRIGTAMNSIEELLQRYDPRGQNATRNPCLYRQVSDLKRLAEDYVLTAGMKRPFS